MENSGGGNIKLKNVLEEEYDEIVAQTADAMENVGKEVKSTPNICFVFLSFYTTDFSNTDIYIYSKYTANLKKIVFKKHKTLNSKRARDDGYLHK